MQKNNVTAGAALRSAELEDVLQKLMVIQARIVAAPAASQRRLEAVHPNYRASAQNLLQYLALRRHDLSAVQLHLAELGLSSLGRAEAHVLATVDAVVGVLDCLVNRAGPPAAPAAAMVDFASGERLLDVHTDALLGAGAHGAYGPDHGDHAERGGG